MNDFLPPKRPLSPSAQLGVPRPVPTMSPRPLGPVVPSVTQPVPQEPLLEQPPRPLLIDAPKRSKKKTILRILIGLIVVVLLAALALVVWYKMELMAVASQSTDKVQIQIASGSTPTQMGQLLEEKKLIRSGFVFDFYTRISGTRMKLQAGTYSFSPTESTEQIVATLVSGKVDQFSITFLPGATLAEDRAGLIKAGFNVSDVDAALKKTYNLPLFAGKPVSADLEGYIYGETYKFNSDATVEQVLTRTFDEFYAQVTQNDLINGFKKQGLTFYQGITLASIIQREVPNATDQKQVAQIFFKRLSMGMPLGSDVTYQYAAKKLGVTPSPSIDSPYNTRLYTGLPPGPIATPGLSALEAVAAPASGDYLYFLSGDDNITYYARTSEEHDQNIQNHCQVKCALP